MRKTLPLRAALAGNALFSFTSGLLMTFFPSRIAEWLGGDFGLLLPFIGVGLIGFSAELAYQCTRSRMITWRAMLASVADALWVVGSLALLLLFPDVVSPFGAAVILAVAAVVLFFGLSQYAGVGLAHRADAPGQFRHCVVIQTAAKPADLWWGVGNLAGISRYSPSLDFSEIIGGGSARVGAIRRCRDHAGREWSEECVSYRQGESYSVRFRTEAPGFPFPVRQMIGGWELRSAGEGCEVRVWWELTPKSCWAAPALLALFAFQADREVVRIVERMVLVHGSDDVSSLSEGKGGIARLLPHVC